MDLSIQNMQPPASLQKKSAAKKTGSGTLDEDAIANTSEDQAVTFTHGNTGYETSTEEEEQQQRKQRRHREARRKNRQLLSGEDLSELTNNVSAEGETHSNAETFMQLKAYQSPPPAKDDDEKHPHFEVNI